MRIGEGDDQLPPFQTKSASSSSSSCDVSADDEEKTAGAATGSASSISQSVDVDMEAEDVDITSSGHWGNGTTLCLTDITCSDHHPIISTLFWCSDSDR